MVATRSRPDPSTVVDGLENSSRKRKRQRGEERPASTLGKKRVAKKFEDVTSGKDETGSNQGDTSKNSQAGPSQHLPLRPHDPSAAVMETEGTQHTSESEYGTFPGTARSEDNREEDPQLMSPTKVKNLSDPANKVDSKPTNVWPKKHVRFGSEEALPSTTGASSLNPNGTPEKFIDEALVTQDDSSSENDEAPEAVTAGEGHEQARASALDAAKAIQIQRQQWKDSRRKKDAQLKHQAKAASSRKRNDTSQGKASREVQRGADDVAHALLASGRLPDFLPTEILNAPPRPTVEQVSTKEARRKQRELANLPSQQGDTPRDVRRGDRVVRVLSNANVSQPPQASTSSKDVRESWLAGQRKGDDSVFAKRRPWIKGFTRR